MAKAKFDKSKKVSKYYDHDCVRNFVLLFMSLITALIVKNSHIAAVIYFIFLRKRRRLNLKIFNIKFRPHCKDQESSYQDLTPFCNLVFLILG